MECPVCLEVYSSILKPKFLIPCGHSLCMVCSETLENCPLCRKIIISSIINYSLLDYGQESKIITNNDLKNKNEKDSESHNQLLGKESVLLDKELTKEQIEVFSFLNEKIEQLQTLQNPAQKFVECYPMPPLIYNKSVGMCGRGGVGKTRLLVEVINHWVNNQKKKVCYVAPTHNAVNIMKNMLHENQMNVSSDNLVICTLSKLIRRNVCYKGKLVLAKMCDYLSSVKNFRLVGYFDLIIIDESSMISVQDLDDISCRFEQEKSSFGFNMQSFPCILFSGDYRQLGPVDETRLPNNSWGNVISDLIFSNREKSRELLTVLRSSDAYIQRLCDSVGDVLESNFYSQNKNFSLNNYTIAKATPSNNVQILNSVDEGIRLYCKMLKENDMSTVWLHVNNIVHTNTLELISKIRLNYFDESPKDYSIGEYFIYNHNFLSIDENLSKKFQSKNPFLSILLNREKKNLNESLKRVDFLTQSFFDIVNNRTCIQLNAHNIVPNERFKIVHCTETTILTRDLLEGYGKKFIQGICVDINHKMKLDTMYLVSSNKPSNMCMVLSKIDLKIDYGTYCNITKSQLNLSISHGHDTIWSLLLCPYKDYVSTINPILKLFDFKKIFPITYVNSIQTFQGSSVDNVIIGEYNLKDAKHLTNIGLFTHLYTALSRAKKRIIIIE